MKEIRKIDDREDYEKSGFKSIMEDVEKIINEAICATKYLKNKYLTMKKPQRNL